MVTGALMCILPVGMLAATRSSPNDDAWDLEDADVVRIAEKDKRSGGGSRERARNMTELTGPGEADKRMFDTVARRCARPIRDCATDVQYHEVIDRVADALYDTAHDWQVRERERCAAIAEAVDSGRGNEKAIAQAIRDGTAVQLLPKATAQVSRGRVVPRRPA
jgi:hypothetical protein